MKKKYDIFISYRRDGGESTAKILRDKLEEMGYHVFFDVESLRSGDFNTRLYSVIDECEDFLIVLSPGALERCVNEDDWVRLELERALEKERNVIPIMLRGFSFPQKLPDTIDVLRYKNGLESNYQFFDAFIERLKSFLKSKPAVGKRLFGRKTGTGLLLFLILAAAGIFAAVKCWPMLGDSPYPKTEKEKNLTGSLVYYIQQNLTQVELAAEYMDNVYRACDKYLLHSDTMDEAELEAELEKNRRLLYKIDTDACAMSEELRKGLEDSPFSAADAAAFHDYLVQFCQGNIDNIDYMQYVTDKESYIDQGVREDVLENYRSMLEEELKIISYGVNGLLLPVEDEKALENFKYEFLPSLYYIPLEAGDWKTDKNVLKSLEDGSFHSLDRSMERITLEIGEQNKELMEDKAVLKEELMEEGVSKEEAQRQVSGLSGKSSLVTEREADLEDTRRELEEKLEEAKKQFAPAEEDGEDMLWGKMLRFMNLGLYDEAIACLDEYREKVRDEDKYAAEYTAAAARFIKNISRTGIDFGLIVTGYGPDDEEHGQFQVGDVIISVNGQSCHNYDEYRRIKETIPEGEGFQAVVLRGREDGGGDLEQKQLDIPGDAPKVTLREMTEKTYE